MTEYMTEQMRHTEEGLERIYRAPYLHGPQVPPVRPILDELAVGSDDVVVDFGSGDGHFTLPLARHLEAQQGRGVVFGCDFCRPLVEALDERGTAEGVDRHLRAFCLEDIEPRTLPFADASVDSVLAVNAIQYLSDPEPYLQEIARVLVPCGSLVVADWREPVSVDEGMGTEKGLSITALSTMVARAGLAPDPELTLPGYAFGMRAARPIVFTL